MTCLDTSIAQFFTLQFWNDRADIIMSVIAAVALAFTIKQLKSSRKESRRTTAYSTYQEYLRLCFDNPKFAYGNKNEIVLNGKTEEQYPWFVSQMLFAFEQILETDKSDNQWKTAIEAQLKRHAWYLKKSTSANREEWSTELSVIIKRVTQ